MALLWGVLGAAVVATSGAVFVPVVVGVVVVIGLAAGVLARVALARVERR